jgi:hypothetical protein
MEIKSVEVGSGSLEYSSEILATKDTSETTGNVTINNVGRPGVPAHFRATFMIAAEFECEGISLRNAFHFDCAVTEKDRNSSYNLVESAAARKLAPMLRLIAAEVEKSVQEFDAKQKTAVA